VVEDFLGFRGGGTRWGPSWRPAQRSDHGSLHVYPEPDLEHGYGGLAREVKERVPRRWRRPAQPAWSVQEGEEATTGADPLVSPQSIRVAAPLYPRAQEDEHEPTPLEVFRSDLEFL
jgi:hypothetical protein